MIFSDTQTIQLSCANQCESLENPHEYLQIIHGRKEEELISQSMYEEHEDSLVIRIESLGLNSKGSHSCRQHYSMNNPFNLLYNIFENNLNQNYETEFGLNLILLLQKKSMQYD